jgi:hypothetical protein
VELLDRPLELEVRPAPATVEVDEAAIRRTLRAQIAKLEHELASIFVSAFPRTGFEWGVRSAGGPRLLGVAELEVVRDSLAQRVRKARAELDYHADCEEQNRRLIEHMLHDPARYKFVRVTNADIGERGCKSWHVRPRYGLLGMVMGWWRVKLSSGCPLGQG